jgi:hypothetical protein
VNRADGQDGSKGEHGLLHEDSFSGL